MTNTWKKLFVTLSLIGLVGGVYAQATIPMEVVDVDGGRIEIRKTDGLVGDGQKPDAIRILDDVLKSPYELEKNLFYAVIVFPKPGFAIESVTWENEGGEPRTRELTLQNLKTVEGVFRYTYSLIGFRATTNVTKSKLTPKFKKSEVVVNIKPFSPDAGKMTLYQNPEDPQLVLTGGVVAQNTYLLVEVVSENKTKRPVVTYSTEGKTGETPVSMRPIATKPGLWQGQVQVGASNITFNTTFAPDNLRVNFNAPTSDKGNLEVKAGDKELKGSSSVLRNTELSFTVKSANPEKEPHLFYLFEKEKLDGAEGGTNERQELTLEKQANGSYTGKLVLSYAVTITVSFGKDGEGTPVEEAQLRHVVVYPNPFEGQLAIRDEAGEAVLYQLFSLQGQLVKAGRIEGVETSVDTEDLPLGIYLLRLKSEAGETKTLRIVKR